MTTISAVDDDQVRASVRQYLYLFKSPFQGVAVVRVPGKAAHADHNAFVQCGGDAGLAAKFMADYGLPFRDAVNLGIM